MDELLMTIAATARETRVLLMQGPDEVMKARLRAVATPANRCAGPMLCESMALWHDHYLEQSYGKLRIEGKQLYTWFTRDADPRGPTTVIAYFALVPFDHFKDAPAGRLTFLAVAISSGPARPVTAMSVSCAPQGVARICSATA